jgi:hypothetical protein
LGQTERRDKSWETDLRSGPTTRLIPVAWSALCLSVASPIAPALPIVERELVAVLLDLSRSRALMRPPQA